MRGFGDSTLISRGHLHAGRSDDIASIVEFLNNLSPLSKISLIGFSLGANIVLKHLIEQSQRHDIEYPVDSAIVVAPPIDLKLCSANLRSYGNRIYDHYFVKQLASGLVHRRRHVANLIDNGMNPIPNRLLQFDDQFTAPVNGFSGARQYYDCCSTVNDLDKIQTPTILVAAQDDPIVPFEIFDTRYFSPSVELVSTRSGGHLGFLGNQHKDPDQHWLDWRICSWIDSLDD
jgi:predicted alpha/beta-fold hydrolase